MYKDPEKNKQYQRQWREKKKAEEPGYDARVGRQYREKNIEKARERERLYTQNNIERALVRSRKWYENNYEQAKESRDIWREENYGVVLAMEAERRAHKDKATPAWYEVEEVRKVYVKCQELNEMWGTNLQVDHILPLRGKDVCGLHCLANLQLLDAELNRKKNTKYCKDG